MDICPKCFGSTDVEPCVVCLGYGVVYPVFETCGYCQGRGCNRCAQGRVAQAYPFTEGSKRYTREQIQDAFTRLRTESPPTDNQKLVAILAGLTMQSEEYTEDTTEPGEWLQNIIRDADALIIDPSGIYLQHGEQGIRIHRFPLN